MADATPVKNRITVVESIYHQEFGYAASSVQARYSRELESDSQPYGPRRMTAMEGWTLLDTGWIDEAGLIVIENLEGKIPSIIPSENDKEELAKKILCVSYGQDPGWLILPGETMKAMPQDLEKLGIRSLFGNTKFNLYVCPK